MERVGIIGAGKIGGSLVARLWEDFDLTVSDIYEEQLERLERAYDIKTTLSNKEVAKSSRLLVIAVKPWDVTHILEEISPVAEGKVVVSVAAGVEIPASPSRPPFDGAASRRWVWEPPWWPLTNQAKRICRR